MDTCPFVGSLIRLFCTCGDVYSWFQFLSKGFPCQSIVIFTREVPQSKTTGLFCFDFFLQCLSMNTLTKEISRTIWIEFVVDIELCDFDFNRITLKVSKILLVFVLLVNCVFE